MAITIRSTTFTEGDDEDGLVCTIATTIMMMTILWMSTKTTVWRTIGTMMSTMHAEDDDGAGDLFHDEQDDDGSSVSSRGGRARVKPWLLGILPGNTRTTTWHTGVLLGQTQGTPQLHQGEAQATHGLFSGHYLRHPVAAHKCTRARASLHREH